MERDQMAKIREELHQFINDADDQTLELIYAVVQAKEETILTEEQQRLLDLTVKEHKEGRSKSYTWAEARAIIEKRQ